MLGNGQPLQGASAMIITEMSGLVAKKRMAEVKKNGLVRVFASRSDGGLADNLA